MDSESPVTNGTVEPPAVHHMWTERKIIIVGLTGALWGTLVGSMALRFLGRDVPPEIYLLATAALGSLATLVTPLSRKQPPTTGGTIGPT
jgi:predicted Co/Zn/Cd cation transporter (cation efflux family)